jgi:lycopene beta-cyclase
VSFPRFQRTLDGEYLCLQSATLARATERILARTGWALRTNQVVAEVGRGHVSFSSGETLTAALVLDARGEGLDAYAGRTGYQKFLGWEIEVAPGIGRVPSKPILMDATVAQLDGYRFMYVLPFSSTRLLVEDTTFSRRRDFDPAVVRERLRAYLLAQGTARFALVREEAGVLPMPWARPARAASQADRLAIGYRGGFFHPGTGYSLPRAVLVAERLARLAAGGPTAQLAATVARALQDLRAAWRPDDRFARLLNRLAFQWVSEGHLRDGVFAPVYGLPADVLARFYAGRTSLGDRLAIAGAPARARLFHQTAQQTPPLGEMP